MPYRTLDPATGELLEEFPTASADDVERALDRADAAFREWSRRPFAERRAVNERLAALLEERAPVLARLMALEMGKPVAEGAAEAKKCAWVARHYAEVAEETLRPRPLASDGSRAFTRPEPAGPILAIMPWNFPFWQVIRVSAPNFMVGNPMLLKHAPSTPRCALMIERLYREAGAPDGLLQNLFLTNGQAADVIRDDRVRGVTLTGSSQAGSAVARVAGSALKPMVAELGGSDPFVALADCDLDEAVEAAATARLINSGQSCIAAKRFLVDRRIRDPFVQAFAERLAAARVGHPTEVGVDVGPLAREDLRDTFESQVEGSVRAGAELVMRGDAPDGGFFAAAGLLLAPPPDAPAWSEELFGPVATVLPFEDEAEAIRIANGTRYGLGASVWTSDPGRAERFAGEIESGAVFVNGITKSDPRMPFGGFKDSGFGRELGEDGLLSFTNRKTVWIR